MQHKPPGLCRRHRLPGGGECVMTWVLLLDSPLLAGQGAGLCEVLGSRFPLGILCV